MGRCFGILALGLCLTGCATKDNIDAGLTELVGHDIKEAVAWFGTPDGHPALAGGQTYVWTTGHNIDVTTQQLGGISGGNAVSRPMSYDQTDTVRQQCTIQMATDQNDRITSYKWSGDGCSLTYALSQIPIYPWPSYQVPVVYPNKARESHLEGEVEIQFTLAKNGSVKDPKIVRSSPEGVFDDAALSSFHEWKYSPAKISGQTIDVPGRHAIIRFKAS